MRVHRIRLTAGEINSKPTLKSLLTKVIWDQCWIIEKTYQEFEQEGKARKQERKETSEFNNDPSPTSILNNDTNNDPNILPLSSPPILSRSYSQSQMKSIEKIKQLNQPMIDLKIHEDPEYQITTVNI